MEGATLHAPGQRLGRYELLGEIASGGMATVFLARALGARGFSRLLAVKRMHPHLITDPEFVGMFLDEARLSARIRHPNVVAVLDVETSPDLYLVMEYVEGDRLSGLIRVVAPPRGAGMPLGPALKMLCDVLEGLHAAHELLDDQGAPLHLVHRDVSPQNILVGADGVARITDFGIAKAESRAVATREGVLKGKISYMAPEQLNAPELVDRRVDVWAMGVVAWETLVGRRLFRGEVEVELLGQLLHSELRPPSAFRPEVSKELDAAVMGALERDVHKRFPTARAFGEALDRAAQRTGGLPGTRAVAELVQELVGPQLTEARQRLRATIAALDAMPELQTPAALGITPHAAPRPASLPTPPPSTAPIAPAPVATRGLRPPVLAALLGGGALLAMATGAALSILRTPAPAQLAHPATVPAAPAPVLLAPPPPPVVASPPPPVVDAAVEPALALGASDAGRRGSATPTVRRPREHDDSQILGVNPYRQ